MSTAVTGVSPARVWELSAWISGVFAMLVGAVMLIGHVYAPTLDPLKSPELKELKTKLRENPADEPTKQAIRNLDLSHRQKYFRQLWRTQSGVYLLLGGVGIFLLSFKQVRALRRELPQPRPNPDAAEKLLRAGVISRRAVAAVGAAAGVFLFFLSLGPGTALPKGQAGIDALLGLAPTSADADSPTASPVADAASPEELLQNWPRFRGPGGNGLSQATNPPANWDPKTGAGIAWKVPTPAKGFNSPLIWGDRVYVCGGDAALREVICLDLKTGGLLWRQAITNVPGSPVKVPEIPESTGYCAASMATDGRRIYAIFANGDLAAFTLDGKPVWSKGFGALKNAYGHATSLATWRDRLIVQLDQGEAEERLSRLYAINGRTGAVLWQKDRKVGSSWASPIVIEAAGKPQIITLAIPSVIAYSATDGAEVWRAELLNGEITPSPVFDGTHVVVASPSDKLVAIRPDGAGEVSKTHVAWTNEDNVPDVTSPVSTGELVFTVTTGGMLTCFDAKTGKKQWEHDYEFECHASPVVAANRVYVIGQKGVAVVVEAARQFKELLRTEMGDTFSASPAFALDRIVMRGETNVWCVGTAGTTK
ncbi:MAG TPA: PQQ-binding-like beta-propeller repeat protein [Verrucomicrobiae bacterium]